MNGGETFDTTAENPDASQSPTGFLDSDTSLVSTSTTSTD